MTTEQQDDLARAIGKRAMARDRADVEAFRGATAPPMCPTCRGPVDSHGDTAAVVAYDASLWRDRYESLLAEVRAWVDDEQVNDRSKPGARYRSLSVAGQNSARREVRQILERHVGGELVTAREYAKGDR